jgi:WD40 repeat protein
MTPERAFSDLHASIAPGSQPFARLADPRCTQVGPVGARLPSGRELLAAYGVETAGAAGRAPGAFVLVWDVRHRRVVRRITAAPVARLALTGGCDGRPLVAALGLDANVRVWDALSGRRLWRRRAALRAGMAFVDLPGGRTALAYGVGYAVRVRDALTGQACYDLDVASQRVPAVAGVRLGDGRSLLAAAVGARVRVWRADTGAELHRLAGHRLPVDSLALHALADGGALLAAGTGQRVRVWDPLSGELRHELVCRREPPASGVGYAGMSMTTTGTGRCLLAYTLVDSADVWLWDAVDGTQLAGVSVADAGPDGRTWGAALLAGQSADQAAVLAVSSGAALELWRLDRVRPRHGAPAAAIATAPASVDASPDRVTSLAFVPVPGARPVLAGAGPDGAWVRDPVTGRTPLAPEVPAGAPAAVAALPQPGGAALLAVARGRSVELYEPAGGRRVAGYRWTGPARLPGLAVLADAAGNPLLVLVRSLRHIAVWDARRDVGVQELTSQRRVARSLAATRRPDGRAVLVTGGYDGAVELWDLDAGERLRTMAPHLGPVKAVAVAARPDGGLAVLSGDEAGVIRIWDGDCGALLATRGDMGGPIAALACLGQPDGGLLVAATVGAGEHRVLRWSTHPGAAAQEERAVRDATAT